MVLIKIVIVKKQTDFFSLIHTVILKFILHATSRTFLRIFFFIQVSFPYSLLMSPDWKGETPRSGISGAHMNKNSSSSTFSNFSCLHTSFFVHIITYKHHKPHFFRHTPIIINLFIFYMLPSVKYLFNLCKHATF